ncbi:MAG: RNA polymerase factor sigma-54 [Clostridiales bacterium]|nr:RNA polymerase factor sigma-54 [Clostridiales bacterium]
MRLDYNLQLEQSQKLIMTPELQQAIKILQLSSIELEQYIQEKIESNPILEISNINSDKEINESKKEDSENFSETIDWKEYIDNLDNYSDFKAVYNKDNDFNYENFVSSETTLQEQLLLQAYITFIDKEEKEIAEYIIYNINDNGYLTMSEEEIAHELSKESDYIKDIIKIIQTFDPPGVCARDLRECLLIQLDHLGIKDNIIGTIIEKYLMELAENNFQIIAKKMGITTKKVQEISDFIKTLEPKPGRRFAPSNNNYVMIDATIQKIGKEYVVFLNDSNIPRLIIRDDYKYLINNDEDSETSKFLKDKFNSAMWLIKNIEQRRQTIYKVVDVISKKQRDFFEYGRKHLKPMTLKEVADEIDVHESTVSRATNGKYVQTPMGTFELKYFFSSGIEGINGEEIAAESIKRHIKEIISKEDVYRPLSDNKICQELLKRGIKISRRTVAKYRDDLNILSSSKRKRYK